jgi:hypothetical protein
MIVMILLELYKRGVVLDVNLCTTMSNDSALRLLNCCFNDWMMILNGDLKVSLTQFAVKLDALDAKFEAVANKLEALGPQKEAPVREEAPEAPDLGAFGHLPVEEQHRMQQRGGDY